MTHTLISDQLKGHEIARTTRFSYTLFAIARTTRFSYTLYASLHWRCLSVNCLVSRMTCQLNVLSVNWLSAKWFVGKTC